MKIKIVRELVAAAKPVASKNLQYYKYQSVTNNDTTIASDWNPILLAHHFKCCFELRTVF